MKEQFWTRLRQPPRIRKMDILWVILPAMLWGAAVQLRSEIIHPHCMEHPDSCQRQHVFFPDQLSIGLENNKANALSFTTQNLSGYLLLGIPAAWNATTFLLGRVTAQAALVNAGTDLLLAVETALWNGTVTEATRLTVQRPRPFVYQNPSILGADPANYTSFYSGHTSFAAASGLALILILLSRGAPLPLLGFSAGTACLLTFLTGLFRVLAGRHFLTDVLVGTLAGAIAAITVAYLHRRSRSSTSSRSQAC